MKRIVLPNAQMLPEVARLVAMGESVMLKAKGCSMLPFIRGERDSVVLEKADGFGVMDIVLAEVAKGVFVLHRVISIEGDRVVLMGDGNIRGCETCRRSDVMAMAVSIVGENGKSSDCRCRSHLVKARIWRFLLPLRRYLLAVYRRIYR